MLKPELVYVSEEAVHDKMTARVLERLPDAKVVYLSERKDPLSDKRVPLNEAIEQGKKSLLLTRHLGDWIEHCPAGTSSHVCCNLWTVNPGEGCPMDCTYCYLQSYLKGNPTLKLYTNPEDMLSEIERKADEDPARLVRVGTGETIDSLAYDDLSDLSLELVPFFARKQNLLLELKTKTNNIDNLLSLKNEHKGKTVVSWSVNAEQVCSSDELGTASLDDRLAAASACVEAGYRVGFHFDPLVYFDGFEQGYRETISKIFKAVSPSQIAWFSIGTLRYRKEMHKTMKERFPDSQIPLGEQFLAPDNKLRYRQPVRLKLINTVWSALKAVDKSLPIYMCMENNTVWRTVSGEAPGRDDNLVEIMSRKGKKGALGTLSYTM